MQMIPSKRSSPRAAGLFGRLAGIPGRFKKIEDEPYELQSESYRASLMRKAVSFTIGRREDDSGV